jgi:hypothetical protein
MQINMEKSSLYSWGMSEEENQNISKILGAPTKENLEGMKYMGFSLKENSYSKKD